MSFQSPAWLFLLLSLPLLGICAIIISRLRKARWAAFASARLRAALITAPGPFPRIVSLVFLLTACAALIIAIARPQGDAGTKVQKAEGRNVLIALDLSKSMRVPDVKPDRLAQAKIVIEEMLEAMPDERFGLIGFAGHAYLYAPLTVDHAAVRDVASQIDETWAPMGGSDIASAVRLAIETLKKTGQRNNALVLISDGERNEGSLGKTIEEAKRAGVYILTVGVGTENGDYVPDKNMPGGKALDRQGSPVISRLQPALLRELATGTKGRFAVAGGGDDVPEMVKAVIKDLDAFQSEGTERRITIEFFQWLVFPAILFLMVSITCATHWRKRLKPGAFAATAAALLLLPRPARADEVAEAREDLRLGRLKEAAEKYSHLAEDNPLPPRKALMRLGEGAAEFRGRKFSDAVSSSSEALLSSDPIVRAQAHFRIGNSLFQNGWMTLAARPYAAPEKPGFEEFDDLVRDYLGKITMSLVQPVEDGPTAAALKDLVTNWSDAVRHFTAAAEIPGTHSKTARSNRELAFAYLKRLQEIMKEEKEKAQQNSGGQGQSGSGDGEGAADGEEQEGEGSGSGDRKNKDGSGDKDQGPPKDQGDGGEKDKGKRPGETPKDHALRKLKENSDLENGPATPGQMELRDPDKDW